MVTLDEVRCANCSSPFLHSWACMGQIQVGKPLILHLSHDSIVFNMLDKRLLVTCSLLTDNCTFRQWLRASSHVCADATKRPNSDNALWLGTKVRYGSLHLQMYTWVTSLSARPAVTFPASECHCPWLVEIFSACWQFLTICLWSLHDSGTAGNWVYNRYCATMSPKEISWYNNIPRFQKEQKTLKSIGDLLSSNQFDGLELLINLLQFLLSGWYGNACIVELAQTQQHGAGLNTSTWR